MNPTDLIAQKAELRSRYLTLRNMLSAEERAAEDAEICNNIARLDEFRQAKTLLLYRPFGSEVDILPLAGRFRQNGGRVAFPVCRREDRRLIFRYVESDSDFVAGVYRGIPEPKDGLPEWNGEPAVCLVPGLIFDRNGFRIGYGGGYYDRFLAGFDGLTMGAVRQGFLRDEPLPHENIDIACQIIITGKGVCLAEKQ